jgi:hypothetical protein
MERMDKNAHYPQSAQVKATPKMTEKAMNKDK